MKEKILFSAFLLAVYAVIYFCFDSNETIQTIRKTADSDVFIDNNGDTVNRTDSKGRRQGKWIIYRTGINGRLSGVYGIDSVGYFKDNKKTGFWKKVSKWGQVIDSVRYEKCIVKIDGVKTYSFYAE